MKQIVTILLFVLMCVQLVFSQKQDRRIALVIGNAAYKSTALRNPVNDANLMERTLKQLGFKVIKTTNAGKNQMRNAIDDFKLQLVDYDVALFYYAGHGMEINGNNYLIPIDAENTNENSVRISSVNVANVVKEFENYTSNTNIVILDACRDNPFVSTTRGGNRGFKMMSSPSGTLIAFATSIGATAADGVGLNGLYTSVLAEEMLKPQRIEDVFINTRNRVNQKNRKQNPQEWSQLRGKFYFAGPEANAKAHENIVGGLILGKVEQQYGSIAIDTEIGGSLYVNGDYLGDLRANSKGNLLRQQLVGRYELRIDGYENFSTTVNVSANDTSYVDVRSRHNTGLTKIYTDPYTGMEFRYIEAGTFMMGSPSQEVGREENEVQHKVTISKSYFIGKYEVTQAEWGAVMGNKLIRFNDCSNCPVEKISWEDAQEFIRKLNANVLQGNYRLPTEAEWEYAVRAGTATAFFGGNNVTTEQVNYDGNYPYDGNSKGKYLRKTTPVGSYDPNAWGLYDMHGNVWEWCSDWYGAYSDGIVTDPKGVSSGVYRVYRGGSWLSTAGACRSANRNYGSPEGNRNLVGLRLVYMP